MKSSSENKAVRHGVSFRTAALIAAVAGVLVLLLLVLLLHKPLSPAVASSPDALDAAQASAPVIIDAATANRSESAPPPAPTEEPFPVYTFSEDPATPLPVKGERLALGEPRSLNGAVSCDRALLNVTVMVMCDYTEDPFYPYTAQVTFSPDANVHSYTFTDAASTLEGVSIAEQLSLANLKTGVHYVVVNAMCVQTGAYPPPPLSYLSERFYVLGPQWSTLSADKFSNGSYETALEFFHGDPDRFLYRYQSVFDRYTVADPDWEAQCITEIQVDGGEPWRVHVDAVPYYERVRTYLNSAHVRVHGSNGDTGILPLMRLIVDYNGSYVSRFTSGKKYFSHHGLGTATDVNAVMEPNLNIKANLALIDTEVREHLTYNGVFTENGASYYDFSYDGSYACTDFFVPESVINYLLYELAFFRAGFQWGHYYNSTSDGMHFTLTDNIRNDHSRGSRALRKVFEYYD